MDERQNGGGERRTAAAGAEVPPLWFGKHPRGGIARTAQVSKGNARP
ncbi:hypothetical protein [Haloferax sp. YSMS24]